MRPDRLKEFSGRHEVAPKSFGELNPAKTFFVIQQESRGRGLFSLLSAVVCLLDVAIKKGYVPVVDFQNFPTIYNENLEVNGTRNSFEYFFKPVSQYRLEEVYASKNVMFSGNRYPQGYDYSITAHADLLPLYQKFFHPRDEVLRSVDVLGKNILPESTLAVHFRGKELRRARGHWYPPSVKQMIKAIEVMMDLDSYSKIFVSSEDPDLIERIDKAFPGQVIFNENYFRARFGNAYKKHPREFHHYRLGLEVLTDMLMLAKCKSLISCTSNVSTFARFVNGGQYARRLIINNGPNNVLPPFQRVSWYVKRALPSSVGGFKLDRRALIVESGL